MNIFSAYPTVDGKESSPYLTNFMHGMPHRLLYLFFQLRSWVLLLCLILPAMAFLGCGGLHKKWTPLSGAVEALGVVVST